MNTVRKLFRLPDLGEGLTDSEIVAWRVAVGDTVALNQTLADVETAKAVVELPSPYAGTVAELFADPGTLVEVGSPLIAFDVPDEAGASGPDAGAPDGAEQDGGSEAAEPRTAAATESATPRTTADADTRRGRGPDERVGTDARGLERPAVRRRAARQVARRRAGQARPAPAVRRTRPAQPRPGGAGPRWSATGPSPSRRATRCGSHAGPSPRQRAPLRSKPTPASGQPQTGQSPSRTAPAPNTCGGTTALTLGGGPEGPESEGGPGERPRSTPPVRKLAHDLGIDLSTVSGTGEHGLITRADIEAAHHAAARGTAPAQAAPRHRADAER